MSITRTALPKRSLLNSDHTKYDYVDSFQGVVNDDRNKLTSVDIGKAFFSSRPKWVGKLFYLRNKIVSLFGLKTSGTNGDRQNQLDNFNCEKGEQIGIFKVFDRTKNEVVLGEDDKHLNFRVSLFIGEQKNGMSKRDLTISTAVAFNNWFGRLYFLLIRPFHKLIVPAMLQRIISGLEN